jgi:ribonuclease Z
VIKLFFLIILSSILSGNVIAAYVEVTLLGTGTPVPDVARFGPATVIEAGGRYFIFDAGRGVTMRLQQAGIPLDKIENIFLTHLHSDHISGLDDLWLTSWIWHREKNLKVYGPVGTVQFIANLQQAYQADISYRIAQADLPENSVKIEAVEIDKDGVIYDENGVRVIVFSVDHGIVKPSYGYRLEYSDRSVVISGDTSYSTNLVKHAQNADLLIHEIASAREGYAARYPGLEGIMAYHTSPEQMLKVMNQTQARLTVLTHVLLYGVSETQVLDKLQREYSGEVYMGEDLMTIGIGDSMSIRLH